MLTLTYGLKRPETNDRASVVFPALQANFEQLDDHDHDGDNSPRIPGTSLQTTIVTILSSAWGADLGGGYYEQTVNCPTGLDYDLATVVVKLSTGEIIHPKITRVTGAQIKIRVFDNTLNNVQVCFN
jgi:hypothetical protein